MARNITLTLGAGLGADLGPNFNLTANVGSVTPATATKTELTAGKSVSVDDAATEVTVTSTGTCTNAISQTIPCATTTTTTTTAAPNTFNVTNNGSSNYIINGVSNGTLSVTEGQTYTFNINASGHPFWIKTVSSTGTGNAYNDGVTNNGTDNGTITFVVPYDAPSTLYYNCQFHSSMTGTINVTDVTTTTTTEAPTTTTTTTEAGFGNITIYNNATFGASIDEFTPAWFIIDMGTIPVTAGAIATGTHSGYVGNFGVTLSSISGGTLTLYVNSVFTQQINTPSDGLYSFIGVTIGSTDTVQIDYDAI
jgi:hypothetical protein